MKSHASDPVGILLVDDKPANLVALESFLCVPGYEIVATTSGPEALARLQDGEFAVILVDVMMPGMDGFEFAVKVREEPAWRDIPMIFLTAMASERADVFHGYEVGAVDYLQKPLDPEVVKAKVAVFAQLFRQRRLIESQAAALEKALSADNARLYRESQVLNRIKDEFLVTLQHELRTPLNAIVGWLSVLDVEPLDPDSVKESLGVMRRSANAQSAMIDDLLDMSSIITGRIELKASYVDLSELMRSALDAVALSAQAKSILLKLVTPDERPVVFGDPLRLRQILWNLLSNALKFTGDGGRVEVALRTTRKHVEMSVTDTGAGIDPGFLPHVFDSFRQEDGSNTRSHGGLGLGLAMVRHLTELHGGTVRAESPGKGQGASFTVALPAALM